MFLAMAKIKTKHGDKILLLKLFFGVYCQVAGDGCIFVWKLPLRMATRMIRAVNENGRLAPETVSQSEKFKQIAIFLEEDNPKDACCSPNYKLVKENVDQIQQRSPWTSSFKFSVSRLPKWAQAKVETSDIASNCQDSISNQVQTQKATCVQITREPR